MAPLPPRVLSLLLAPQGQLSGDGQLRELIAERRASRGTRAEIWYLPPAQVRAFGLGAGAMEAVVAGDPAVITWLALRFGGECRHAPFDAFALEAVAEAPPPPPAPAISPDQ